MIIYFRSPAVKVPYGGVINYFALAQLLRRLGQPATVVSDEGLETGFLPPDIEPAWQSIGSVSMTESDVLVTPEWWTTFVAEAGPARILPWCQGAFEAKYEGLTLALSRFASAWARERGADPVLMMERILTPFWQPPPASHQRDGVLIVPSKNGTHNLADIVPSLLDTGIRVSVVKPELTATALRDLFWSHQIYLGLSYPEGLDMLCQEAMACRCAVVAYAGGGRTDYLWHNETGIMVGDGDWRGIITAVYRVLDFDHVARRLVDTAEAAIERYRLGSGKAQAQAARILEALQ